MTENSPVEPSISLASLSGDAGVSGGGFLAGSFPPPPTESAERPLAGECSVGSPAPMIVGQFHGILTGQSSPTWPTFGTGFFADLHPGVRTVDSHYFAWPLPRVEALRNRGRSRRLTERMIVARQQSADRRGVTVSEVPVALVSHSNGAVLALQVTRELIAWGIPVRALVLIAPALRTGPASREIAEWMARGMLDYALLVRPMRDELIGGIGANWRTKLYAWPWGSLGSDGWDVDAWASHTGPMPETIDLPGMRHSDPVAPSNREWLYQSIVAPALGLSAWGSINPEVATV